jgi:hypothetical protein
LSRNIIERNLFISKYIKLIKGQLNQKCNISAFLSLAAVIHRFHLRAIFVFAYTVCKIKIVNISRPIIIPPISQGWSRRPKVELINYFVMIKLAPTSESLGAAVRTGSWSRLSCYKFLFTILTDFQNSHITTHFCWVFVVNSLYHSVSNRIIEYHCISILTICNHKIQDFINSIQINS